MNITVNEAIKSKDNLTCFIGHQSDKWTDLLCFFCDSFSLKKTVEFNFV